MTDENKEEAYRQPFYGNLTGFPKRNSRVALPNAAEYFTEKVRAERLAPAPEVKVSDCPNLLALDPEPFYWIIAGSQPVATAEVNSQLMADRLKGILPDSQHIGRSSIFGSGCFALSLPEQMKQVISKADTVPLKLFFSLVPNPCSKESNDFFVATIASVNNTNYTRIPNKAMTYLGFSDTVTDKEIKQKSIKNINDNFSSLDEEELQKKLIDMVQKQLMQPEPELKDVRHFNYYNYFKAAIVKENPSIFFDDSRVTTDDNTPAKESNDPDTLSDLIEKISKINPML